MLHTRSKVFKCTFPRVSCLITPLHVVVQDANYEFLLLYLYDIIFYYVCVYLCVCVCVCVCGGGGGG